MNVQVEYAKLESDWLTCVCKNSPESDGFATSDEAGRYVEPALNGDWNGRSVTCLSCGRVVNQDDGLVTGRATTEILDETRDAWAAA